MDDKQIQNRFENQAKSKTFQNIIRAFNLDQKAVLDIGCAYGEYLINFGKQSVGVTIIKDEVDYGIRRGLDMMYGNIETDDLIFQKKFDVIFANNLLEHLYSPHNFLCNIKQYLKEDGFLILGVPCVPTIKYLLNIKKFNGSLAASHVNFFTKYTLSKTVERSGWNIISIRGFRLQNKKLDLLLNPIYPHFYVIAKPDKDFKYGEKRMKQLIGYLNSSKIKF